MSKMDIVSYIMFPTEIAPGLEAAVEAGVTVILPLRPTIKR